MSLLPSSSGRKRDSLDSNEVRNDQFTTDELRKAIEKVEAQGKDEDAGSHEIFDLVPPSANDRFDPKAVLISAPEPASTVKLEPSAASIAAVAAALQPKEPGLTATDSNSQSAKPGIDLSRLTIDGNGHLYWDGKPVEMRRRVTMSPGQIFAATIIGLFVIIGGTGAAINGSAVAFEWGCKLGWIRSHCAAPALLLPPPPPAPRVDIPT
jgi:hypothetical protein